MYKYILSLNDLRDSPLERKIDFRLKRRQQMCLTINQKCTTPSE